jgi:hypothetical protein
LRGLGNLTTINHWLRIEGNGALRSLAGLESLEDLGVLVIRSNRSLPIIVAQAFADSLAERGFTGRVTIER